MDVKGTIAWSQTAFRYSLECTNETLSKSILIIPFFAQLGYAPHDPRSVMQEHQVHGSKKYPDRADIVLFAKGKPVIIVECKAPGRISSKNLSQLNSYFKRQEAVLALLTDGLNFFFFSDADNDGELDEEPFFSLSLEKMASRGFNETELEFLTKISRDGFDENWVSAFSYSELLRIRIAKWLSGQLKNPSAEFCRFVLAQLNVKRIRDKKIDVYATLLQEAFTQNLASEIFQKINDMRSAAPSSRSEKTRNSVKSSKIVTTDHEIYIFQLCKNRLAQILKRKSEIAEIDNISFRDRIEKFCVYYKNINKGRLFDYYEQDGRDRFDFYINDQKQTILDIQNIDEPLLSAFRQRVSEAQNW